MRVWLQEMKWEEVRDHLQKDDVIIIPVGSTEQHGHHLPLGTDSMVAIALAEDAAKESGALVAPPIWYGWSPHHMAYPGTITIRPETLIELMMDVCHSLIYHGFHRLIILNGHRVANMAPLTIAATRLREQTGAYVAVADPFFIGDRIGREVRESEPGGLGHADELETGHLLYFAGELADMSKAQKRIGALGRFCYFHLHDPLIEADSVLLPSTAEEFGKKTAPTGVSGDPTLATREKGEKYHRAVVENLVALIEEARATKVSVKRTEIPV
jgi:creatinine amidohydrolase